jgi:hypothetical protein
VKCSVGDGTTVLFWSDIWNDLLLQDKFPRLFSFTKDKLISVAKFLSTEQLGDLFHLPLSNDAWQEYQALQVILQEIQVTKGDKDCWKYIWGNSDYSASKFYKLHFSNIQPPGPFIWIWDSKCSNKIKIFGWLMLIDRLNVRNILRRKNYNLEGNDYTCVLCTTSREETTFHLFFLRPFSQECWRSLHINWNFSLDFSSMMEEAKRECRHGFFMEVFLIGCWLIWKQRNAFIFNRGPPSFQSWKAGFIDEANLQSYRMNIAEKEDFPAFLSSLV